MKQLLRLAKAARGERAQLPRLRRFLPLIAQAAVARRRRGSSSVLRERAARLARGAVAIQLAPVRTEETLQLAAGCRDSGTMLRVQWDSPASPAFAEWHRSVIGSGLLPYVEVLSEIDPSAPEVGLVHRGS